VAKYTYAVVFIKPTNSLSVACYATIHNTTGPLPAKSLQLLPALLSSAVSTFNLIAVVFITYQSPIE
jgi:hypothetical protein